MGHNSATIGEVKEFLEQLRNWLILLGGQVIYDTRAKNLEFMAAMEWYRPDQKKEAILTLEPEDYFEGPLQNESPCMGHVWIFGKRIKGYLCYIKIHLALKPNVYCISFHFAEHDMFLPLKNKTERI